MLRRLFLAAGLSVAGVTPALAVFTDQEQQQFGPWVVRTQQDAALPGQPRRCVAQNTMLAGQISLIAVISQPLDGSIGDLNGYVSLFSPGWHLDRDSEGLATIQVDGDARTFQFRGVTANEMYAAVPPEDGTFPWLGRLLSGERLLVRLPDGEAAAVPSPDVQVKVSFYMCAITLTRAPGQDRRQPSGPAR